MQRMRLSLAEALAATKATKAELIGMTQRLQVGGAGGSPGDPCASGGALVSASVSASVNASVSARPGPPGARRRRIPARVERGPRRPSPLSSRPTPRSLAEKTPARGSDGLGLRSRARPVSRKLCANP